MRTVSEMSRITGVSVRTLHHYDSIGLLRPTEITDAGYRLYDDAALQRLHSILMFRELRFSLKEIGRIIDSDTFDPQAALQQQIALLELQRAHLDDIIAHARQIQKTGVIPLNFQAFDKTQMDEYAAEAKRRWGSTDAYKEYEERRKEGSASEGYDHALMDIFVQFGTIRHLSPESSEAQALAAALQAHITNHYYTCTKPILRSLGMMYTAGGSMTDNIDAAGGEGTAAFTQKAIEVYCK